MCPAQDHFNSRIADYIDDFCLLHDPDVGPSVLVCHVEHKSFHFSYPKLAANLRRCRHLVCPLDHISLQLMSCASHISINQTVYANTSVHQ